jgi:hypothetical protein
MQNLKCDLLALEYDEEYLKGNLKWRICDAFRATKTRTPTAEETCAKDYISHHYIWGEV